MPFSINEFRSQMTGDGARPNLFEVNMPFPSFASPGNSQQKMSFMCKSAQLPGSTVGVIPTQYFGREVKFAGNRVFSDWVVTVINDEDFLIRNSFDRWLNGINSHSLNLRDPSAASPSGYTVDATVNQYGKTGNIIKTYKFIGMFPFDITPIDLDWGANDTIEEYSVSLAYQWWTSEADGIS